MVDASFWPVLIGGALQIGGVLAVAVEVRRIRQSLARVAPVGRTPTPPSKPVPGPGASVEGSARTDVATVEEIGLPPTLPTGNLPDMGPRRWISREEQWVAQARADAEAGYAQVVKAATDLREALQRESAQRSDDLARLASRLGEHLEAQARRGLDELRASEERVEDRIIAVDTLLRELTGKDLRLRMFGVWLIVARLLGDADPVWGA